MLASDGLDQSSNPLICETFDAWINSAEALEAKDIAMNKADAKNWIIGSFEVCREAMGWKGRAVNLRCADNAKMLLRR